MYIYKYIYILYMEVENRWIMNKWYYDNAAHARPPMFLKMRVQQYFTVMQVRLLFTHSVSTHHNGLTCNLFPQWDLFWNYSFIFGDLPAYSMIFVYWGFCNMWGNRAVIPSVTLSLVKVIAKSLTHDDVIKWEYFPRNWPSVRGIHWTPMNSPHKGQWRRALMFSLICAGTNSWANYMDTSSNCLDCFLPE